MTDEEINKHLSEIADRFVSVVDRLNKLESLVRSIGMSFRGQAQLARQLANTLIPE